MKQRRVGTFTLGITLILIGVIVPLAMIFKDKATILLQFTPLVLILLGVEVLIYAIKFREDKLKYDGASIFIVIMITILSIGTTSIAPIVSRAYTNQHALEAIAFNAEDSIDNALEKNGLDGSVDVYSSNYNSVFLFDEQPNNINLSANVKVIWRPTDKVPTKDEIADKILPFLSAIDVNIKSLDISVRLKDTTIVTIDFNRFNSKNLSREKIINNINTFEEDTNDEENS